MKSAAGLPDRTSDTTTNPEDALKVGNYPQTKNLHVWPEALLRPQELLAESSKLLVLHIQEAKGPLHSGSA